jgi:RNA polymerase sigma-70 factor (ECF subfamily)
MVEEAQIIEGCKRNDQQSKTLLYKEHAASLYGVALRYTQSEEDAQDVLQDAFLKIFDSMEKYDGRGALGAWLTRIVINEALNFHRKRPKAILVDYEDYEEKIADDSIVKSDKLTHEMLLGFIRKLPQEYKEAFNLCIIDGYSYHEVAQKLKCNEAKCRMWVFKARNILKNKVNLFLEKENKYKYEYEDIQ